MGRGSGGGGDPVIPSSAVEPLDDGVTYLSPSQRSRSLSLAGGNLFAESLAAYLLSLSSTLTLSVVRRLLFGGGERERGRHDAAAGKIARAWGIRCAARARWGMDFWHVKTFAWHDKRVDAKG